MYLSTLLSLTLNAQSIFLKAQNSGWYKPFLTPVVNAISTEKKILDIGTGPGKLLQLFAQKDTSLILTGIDIDSNMIYEARKRVKGQNISFEFQEINKKLAFEDNSFDAVTFCSVLFLLDDSTKQFLVNEALRVLKPDGKIIVLTPSGKKSILSSFVEVWRYPFKATNWTFIIWKTFTTHTARKWQRKMWLKNYATSQQLAYSNEIVFNKNATLEILSKNNSTK